VLFAGQVTQPLHLRSPGNARVIGVRFRPAGARAFLGRPMREVTDRRVAIPGPVPADAEAFVLDRVRRLGIGEDDAARRCAERIEASAGQVSVAELTALCGLGRRQLERRFADAVGVGPALLAAIFRFRRVFDVIEHDAARPWTDAALDAGYYDQSHFIRDFRRFVGCTPSEFQRSRGALAAALVEG
jgi:AraC-like DNA-binding protein